MDYCVSLGNITTRELMDWGNSKGEVREFFSGEDFKKFVEEVREKTIEYCDAKKIRVQGIEEEIGIKTIEESLEQSIIAKLAEENVKSSFEGKEWSEVAKSTLDSQTWLRTTIAQSTSGIISRVYGRYDLAKTYGKESSHISQSWLIVPDDTRRDIALYSIEGLVQWGISEGVFERIRNLDLKVQEAFNQLRRYSSEKGILNYSFPELLSCDKLKRKVQMQIAKELGDVYATVNIKGGNWAKICEGKLSDDEWVQRQVDVIKEAVEKKMEELRKTVDDLGYCYGDSYSSSWKPNHDDDAEDRIHSI